MKKKESKRQLVLHKLEKLAASTPYSSEAQTARTKIEELKIHRVIVQVAPANDGGDPGEVAIGYYIVENGDTLVMTDAEGAPIKHRAIEAVKLLPDQTAEQVARGLVHMRASIPDYDTRTQELCDDKSGDQNAAL